MEVQEIKTDEKEITLLDLFIIMAKRKRLILAGTLLITLLMGILSLLMDPIYQGEAKVIIPQSSSSTSSMLAQTLGISGGMISGLMGSQNLTNMYAGLLKSRRIADGLLDQHKLYEYYKSDRTFPISLLPLAREDAVKKTTSDMSVEPDTDSGLITVRFNHKDREKVADLTNFIVDELMKLNQGLIVTDAAHRRMFYEGELRKTHEALSRAEEEIKGFQETSGAIQIEDQAKAILEGIATLEAQIAAKEVQLRVMKSYATPQNPDLKRTKQELEGLRDQRRRLESRTDGTAASIIPTSQIPSLGTDYLRKMRDFKYQETLYLLLLKMLESSRMDEAMESGAIQIVDRAVTPDAKSRPRISILLAAGLFIGFILSVFAAFFLEYLDRKATNPESRDKWQRLQEHLKRV